MQHTTHQAEMNAADDLAALAGKAAERAVMKADRFTGLHGPVGLEADITKKTDQASDRLGLVDRNCRILDHRPTPPLSGFDCSGAGVRDTCELLGKNPGQSAIGLGIRLVHVRPEGIGQARSSASG